MTSAKTSNTGAKPARRIKGKSFAFFGNFSRWPSYYESTTCSALVESLGASVRKTVTRELDYLVIGDTRAKGRSQARKDAEKFNRKGAKIEILDEREFLYLVKPEIKGSAFAFVGTFSKGPAVMDEGPAALLKGLDVKIYDDVGEDLDYLVMGDKRAKGKAAYLRKMKEYNARGADIRLLNETQFLDLIGIQKITKKGKLDLPELVLQLRGVLDHKKIDRAIKMLKKESFQLYVDLEDDKLGGIIKSQTNPDHVYASYISSEGLYGCHDEELGPCWGLQGKVCKHIIVLLLGMSQNGDLDPRNAYQWALACHKKGPKNNEEIATRLLLRYKGALLGEIDWRPNETIPEDYYAL